MREGEEFFNSKDHVDHALIVVNNILNVVSIVLMLIDIVKTVLFH